MFTIPFRLVKQVGNTQGFMFAIFRHTDQLFYNTNTKLFEIAPPIANLLTPVVSLAIPFLNVHIASLVNTPSSVFHDSWYSLFIYATQDTTQVAEIISFAMIDGEEILNITVDNNFLTHTQH